MTKDEALERLVSILNSREESDSGNVFQPTYITTCRVMHSIELREILPILGVK